MDPEKIAQKIVKIFDVTIKDINESTKTIVAVVSTNKVDRHGDIVTPEAFKKRLKHYKDHPVLLSSHDYYDLRKQIGEATKVSVTDTGLEVGLKYYADLGNPEADWAWILAQKHIAAFSIGFMGHEFEWLKDKDKESGNEYITGRKFTDVELLEVSQVLVPANRQSLQERNDYQTEAGKLAEMAVKAMDSGEIKEIPVSGAKKEEKVETNANTKVLCPECNGECKEIDIEIKGKMEKRFSCEKCHPLNNDRSHYSENILADGPEAKSQAIRDVLKGAVKDAVKAALQ